MHRKIKEKISPISDRSGNVTVPRKQNNCSNCITTWKILLLFLLQWHLKSVFKKNDKKSNPKVLLWKSQVSDFSPALPLYRAEVHCAFHALLFCPLPAILKFPLHIVLKQLGHVNHASISLWKHGSSENGWITTDSPCVGSYFPLACVPTIWALGCFPSLAPSVLFMPVCLSLVELRKCCQPLCQN